MHVTKMGESVLEWDRSSFFLSIDHLILEIRLATVGKVRDRLSEVLLSRFQVGELIHFY